MHPFEYQAPTSLADAIRSMQNHGASARPLAGGTDLIDQMRTGRHQPNVLVDVKKISELNILQEDDQGLRIGAAVPCHRIYETDTINHRYTALADSCHILGGIQIQSRASIGGNLCNAGPAADSTPSMIALGGVCVISGPDGTREVAVESFCVGPGENVLAPGELLVEVRFPAPPRHSGSHYRRVIPRNEMDIAIAGVGANVVLSNDGTVIEAARIALGAVAPTPLLAEEAGALLKGQTVTDQHLSAAAEAAQSIVSPITDMRGTEAYRVHITGVLVERVLRTAISRARGEDTHHKPGH